uniref:Uncharacterized protein n=1 Tax=Salix viminalis TaxID=40686 RepID=A0A6N2MEH4_SALVM
MIGHSNATKMLSLPAGMIMTRHLEIDPSSPTVSPLARVKEKKSLDKEINQVMKKRQQEQHINGRENGNYQQNNHYQLHLQKQIQCNKGKLQVQEKQFQS